MQSRVPVERYVEQVVDGSHYNGYVIIAGTKITYELKLTVPISKLDDMEPVKGTEEARRVFQFAVKKGEDDIELTDEEYGFFLHMLLEFAVQFYNLEQTRGSNQGEMGALVHGHSPLVRFGASVSIGMTDNIRCDFGPELSAMLNTRFGCALAVEA